MNRTNLKERGFSILASLLFHVAVLFVLIKVVPPVRIYVYRQVADVRIVSPETIYLARMEEFSEEIQTSGFLPQQTLPEDLSVRREEDLQRVEQDPGVVYLRNLGIGRDIKRNRERQDFSGTIPQFELLPLPKSKGGFSLEIGRMKSESEELGEKDVREDVDFSKYSTPALSSLHFNRVVTQRGKGGPSNRINQQVISQQEGYDITPWVREVVDKIRDNWTLPSIDDSIAMGEVKIYIVIGKQGNLVAMEIVESSDFQAFDQTTTGAIRSSTPFPSLPDNFPFDRLEAYLVFQFNE